MSDVFFGCNVLLRVGPGPICSANAIFGEAVRRQVHIAFLGVRFEGDGFKILVDQFERVLTVPRVFKAHDALLGCNLHGFEYMRTIVINVGHGRDVCTWPRELVKGGFNGFNHQIFVMFGLLSLFHDVPNTEVHVPGRASFAAQDGYTVRGCFNRVCVIFGHVGLLGPQCT